MITIKSQKEIDLMRKACRTVAIVHQEIKKIIRVGMTLNELDKIATDIIINNDCKPSFLGYHGFPKTICASVNEELIHGIPSDYKIKDGDLVSIDVGCTYQGYHADAAFSIGVGKVSEEVKKILEITEQSLYEAIKIVKANIRVGDIGACIQKFVESKGYHLTEMFTGHGIGTQLHEDPHIPNVGIAGTGVLLKENMTICIEPMVIKGTKHVVIDKKDKWTVRSKDKSLTCHFEHQLLIKKDGCEILTIL